MGFLDDLFDFEKSHLKTLTGGIFDDPKRLLLGVDPLSTKMWNEVLGRDDRALVSQFGGPTEKDYQDAIDAGVDIGAAQGFHTVAEAIASIYGGGAAAGALGGIGYGTAGSTVGSAAGGAGQAVLDYAIPAAAGAIQDPMELQPQRWSSGPGQQMGPLSGMQRRYNFNLGDPYTYGMGPEQNFLGGLRGVAEGGYIKGYAEGGSIDDVNQMVKTIGDISQVPGGAEMLITVAAEELGGKGGKTKQLRLYSMGGPVGYQGGGLTNAVQAVRGGGRGDDEMLLHLAPEEYEAITSMWGPPDINPNTGLPEYGFFSDFWKNIKRGVKDIVKSPIFSFVAPLALNYFAPGLGSKLGGALGAGEESAALVGDTLIRAGAGAASSGTEGAIAGAVSGLTSGGVGSKLGSKLGLEGEVGRLAGDALLGGVGGELGGGDFGGGALGQLQHSLVQPGMEKQFNEEMAKIFGTKGEFDVTPQAEPLMSKLPGDPQMSPIPPSGDLTVFGDPEQPGFFSRIGSWIKDNPEIAASMAGIIGQGFGGSSSEGGGMPGLPSEFLEGIPQYDFERERQSLSTPGGYYTYGQTGSESPGEHQFFTNNTIGQPGAPGGGLPDLGGPRGGPRDGGRRGRGSRGRGSYPGAALVPGGPSGPGLPGLEADFDREAGQPLSGRYWPVKARALEQQGWTVDWGSQMAYPPGGDPIYGNRGGYARGNGSGREDLIEAMLSDGEYVMDAETVALLGDGSNDAGARRLDEMREELRKHKGKNLSKGKFSHDAKNPMQYLKKGGTVTKRTIQEVAYEVMDNHIKADKPKGHDVESGLQKKKKMKKARGGGIRPKKKDRELVDTMAIELLGD